MTDPNDMEDPQAGEILPPILLEAWYVICLGNENLSQDSSVNESVDRLIKIGMELAYQQLKPLMQAALPYYEAGVKDTRIEPADAGKLAELAAFKELVAYKKELVEYE